MKDQVERASRWIYRGVWAVLVRWFRVPEKPPTLPTPPGEEAVSFRPAEGFLRYLKLKFWIVLTLVDGAVLVGWIVVTAALPWLGVILALPALVIAVFPDILAYIAIHLRYDTTWYVITRRSLRIRRGIWIIHETTITFENIQNITVMQGPIERFFGIANVVVETAGGGGRVKEQHGGQIVSGHTGLMEGVSNAAEIRDLILRHVRQTQTGGLGDEMEHAARPAPAAAWTAAHLALLREIRDAAHALGTSST
ncbi:MAG: PH domain-containing protein [Planctomycetia bacterium]|nr:PH domain-containing protein [Planctomycetia bacterium]